MHELLFLSAFFFWHNPSCVSPSSSSSTVFRVHQHSLSTVNSQHTLRNAVTPIFSSVLLFNVHSSLRYSINELCAPKTLCLGFFRCSFVCCNLAMLGRVSVCWHRQNFMFSFRCLHRHFDIFFSFDMHCVCVSVSARGTLHSSKLPNKNMMQ